MDLQKLNEISGENDIIAFPMNLQSYKLDSDGKAVCTEKENSFHSFVLDGIRYFINVYPKADQTDFVVFAKITNLPFSAECQDKRFDLVNEIETLKKKGFAALGILEKSSIGFRFRGSVKGELMLHDFIAHFLQIFTKYRKVIHNIRQAA